MAAAQPHAHHRHLARDLEGSGWRTPRSLQRCRRRRALLRLDRQPPAQARRRPDDGAPKPTQTGKRVVGRQQDKDRVAARRRPHDEGGPCRHRPGESRRQLVATRAHRNAVATARSCEGTRRKSRRPNEFQRLPPSVRRAVLEWITQAKSPETRTRRVAETARLATDTIRANHARQLKSATPAKVPGTARPPARLPRRRQ